MLILLMRSSLASLFVGFFGSILLLIVVGLYWYGTFNNWNKANEVLQHNFEILQFTENVLSVLKDIETSQRGYIITHDSSFLKPFKNAITAIYQPINHLDTLITDKKQQQNMDKLRLLIQERIYYAEKSLSVAFAPPKENPHLKVIYMRKGQQTMDSTRALVESMKQMELAKQPSLSRYKIKFALQTTIALMLSLALSIALFVGMFLKMIQELSRRVRSEKQLARNLTDLERSNQSLDAFSYVSVHHLQEPLRKLNIFCDRLNQKYREELSADVQFLVEKLNNAALEMRELIQDLTMYTSLGKQTDQQQYIEVELEEILQTVLDENSEEVAKKSAQIEIFSLPLVKGNPEQLRLLFTHLLANSLKFAQAGVPLSIQIGASPASGREIPGSMEMDHDRRFHRINFTDNGIGIDKKYIHVIFELFQRLNKDKQIPGTGVGLTLCKKIISNHNGYISLKSQVNQGTTFFVYFPTH